MRFSFDKFKVDLIWNLVSFLFVGLMGVFLNAFVINKYGIEILGVFNQNYAIYLFLSQLAVGGVHLSVQKLIPEYHGQNNEERYILLSSLGVTSVTSVIVITIAWFLKELPGRVMDSAGVTHGFKFVIPGLLFFSYNKIMLAYFNGKRRMKTFAVFQFLRFSFMVSFVILFPFFHLSPVTLSIILSCSEFLLFVIMACSLRITLTNLNWRDFVTWYQVNWSFGRKALMGNFLFDANTKVDIFIIGIFLNDKAVGIYSFAALVVEGFGQLSVIFRNNINPILTKCYNKKQVETLGYIIRKSKMKFFKIICSIGVLSIIGFPVVLHVFGETKYISEMWSVYAILALGISLTSGYQPFIMLFNQLGNAILQTKLIFAIFLSNVLLNIFLIPMFGIYGSAMATALSNVVFVYCLKYYSKINYQLHI